MMGFMAPTLLSIKQKFHAGSFYINDMKGNIQAKIKTACTLFLCRHRGPFPDLEHMPERHICFLDTHHAFMYAELALGHLLGSFVSTDLAVIDIIHGCLGSVHEISSFYLGGSALAELIH